MSERTIVTSDGQTHTGEAVKVTEPEFTLMGTIMEVATLGVLSPDAPGQAEVIDRETGQHFTGKL